MEIVYLSPEDFHADSHLKNIISINSNYCDDEENEYEFHDDSEEVAYA